MNYLALSIDGTDCTTDDAGKTTCNTIQLEPPTGVPTGGLEAGGAGQLALQFGVQAFFFAATLLAVIFVLVGGIKWITAGGDKTKVQSARSTLTYAIIGLVIVLGAFTIVLVLGSILGFTLLYAPLQLNPFR